MLAYMFHDGFATELGSASSTALEAMCWPYVAREGVRRELRQDGGCPVDTTLNLAHEGWVQHEKKSSRPLVSIHPKERNRRRLRVTARGAHTNTGHY